MRSDDILEIIKEETGTTLQDISENTELGKVANVSRALKRKNPTVKTLVELCEVMGYQIVITNGYEEYVLDEWR